MPRIVEKRRLTPITCLYRVDAPLIARAAKAGQFVILKANEEGERIPLTMAETNVEKGTITVIYMVVGKSTALFRDLFGHCGHFQFHAEHRCGGARDAELRPHRPARGRPALR